MRVLPDRISKNGYHYSLVQRWTNDTTQKSVAIYSQQEKGNERIIAWEVFIIPVNKKDSTTPTGYVIEAGEKFPSNEQFGKTVVASSIQNTGKNAFDRVLQEFELFKEKTYKSEKDE